MASKNFRSIRFKLEVIDYFKSSERPSKRKTAHYFQICPNMVRKYLNKESELRVAFDKRKTRTLTRRTGFFEAEELKVLSWFNELRLAKIPVSGLSIKNEMRITVQANHLVLKKKFTASDGWLHNFLKRRRLTRRRITTSGRPLPDDSLEIIDNYLDDLNNLIEDYRFHPFEILAMDETTVYMDAPGSYTYEAINSQRVQAVTTGKEKTRVSNAVTASFSGNKLDIMAVIQRKFAICNMRNPDNVLPVYTQKGT